MVKVDSKHEILFGKTLLLKSSFNETFDRHDLETNVESPCKFSKFNKLRRKNRIANTTIVSQIGPRYFILVPISSFDR